MRISDWSSDVCSSDLLRAIGQSLAESAVLIEIVDGKGAMRRIAFDRWTHRISAQRQHQNVIGDRHAGGQQHLAGCIRSEEHTSELQSRMRNSYAVFCLKKKTHSQKTTNSELTLLLSSLTQ